MSVLLVVGFLLDLAGLAGLSFTVASVLEPPWSAVVAGLLPAIASAASLAGVWRAHHTGRRLPLIAFAISANAWLAFALELGSRRYDASLVPLGLALIAQATGWCGLLATGAPPRRSRRIVAFLVAALVVVLHVALPVDLYLDAAALEIASFVLISDVETAEQLARHRAAVRDEQIRMATTFAAEIAVIGAVALVLLLLLWRRPRRVAAE